MRKRHTPIHHERPFESLDIRIEFVGLRPGEKEYEELLTRDENVTRTEHDKLWVVRREGASPLVPVDLSALRVAVDERDPAALRDFIRSGVPDHLFADEPGDSPSPRTRAGTP